MTVQEGPGVGQPSSLLHVQAVVSLLFSHVTEPHPPKVPATFSPKAYRGGELPVWPQVLCALKARALSHPGAPTPLSQPAVAFPICLGPFPSPQRLSLGTVPVPERRAPP